MHNSGYQGLLEVSGVDLELIENGEDSGIFIGSVPVAVRSNNPGLFVEDRDLARVRYEDARPLRGSNVGFFRVFYMGEQQSSVTIDQPIALDYEGERVREAVAGRSLDIKTTVKNENNDYDITVVTIVMQVVNAEGKVVFIDREDVEFNGMEEVDSIIPWTPEETGNYQIHSVATTIGGYLIVLSERETSALVIKDRIVYTDKN